MTCDDLRGSYELYSLGILEEPELLEVREHLARSCPQCTQEMRRAIEMNSMLLAAIPDAAPSPQLRTRILVSIGAKQPSSSLPWWVAIASALVTCLFAFLFINLRNEQQADAARLAEMRSVVALLTEPETRTVTFGKGPQGRVLINPRRGVLLIASNLPPVAPGKTYAFWIIPKGGAPRPAGLFQSDRNGTAMHSAPGPLDLGSTGAVAVSVEPEGGSPAPTTTPVIVAPLTGD